MPRTPSTMAICPPEKKGCIEEALKLFERAETEQGKNCSYNVAKCLYEKTRLLIHSYGTIERGRPSMDCKTYY